jgi:probable rRNA maturation factor
MNRVDVSAEEIPLPDWAGNVENFVQKILSALEKTNWDVSILFCSNLFIQELNKRYRNKDEATDVLSFPQGDTIAEEDGEHFIAGDIIISPETLLENAAYFKVSIDEELRRLLIHGILHLNGLDHATNAPTEPMLQLQEKILQQINNPRRKRRGIDPKGIKL